MNRFFFLLLIGYGTLPAAAQPQHVNWYFGFNAGLTFLPSGPIAATNGALSTDEGTACISDANGQLLFYTNGENVYNAAHTQMPNGYGLHGSFSTAQSAVIVPFPADSTRYYVFTQAAQAGAAFMGNGFGGLAYSVIDLSLDGGLGDVSVKNMLLADTTCESLCAAQHANGREAWVLTHPWNSDAFYAYRVSCQGVAPAPVVSVAGRMHADDTPNRNGAIGCMKVSPDHSKLAIAWSQFYGESSSHARLDVFDFDNATGIVTLIDSLTFDTAATTIGRGYGVEFSPNSRFVYCSVHGLDNGTAYTHLYQVDFFQSDLDAAKQVVATGFNAFGSLQTGPDGKLYIARLNGATYLSALEHPDSLGTASGFLNNAVSLSGKFSTWGLPNNWTRSPAPAPPELVLFSDTVLCHGDFVTLQAKRPYGDHGYAFLWNTGSTAHAIDVGDQGVYTVRAFTLCDTITDEVIVKVQDCLCKAEWPTVVTPNGDGLNDMFLMRTENCSFAEFSVIVFNRWGNRMFSASDPQFEWRPPSPGTYFYTGSYMLQGAAKNIETHDGYFTVIE